MINIVGTEVQQIWGHCFLRNGMKEVDEYTWQHDLPKITTMLSIKTYFKSWDQLCCTVCLCESYFWVNFGSMEVLLLKLAQTRESRILQLFPGCSKRLPKSPEIWYGAYAEWLQRSTDGELCYNTTVTAIFGAKLLCYSKNLLHELSKAKLTSLF